VKRLRILTIFKIRRTHYYAILARKLVKAGQVSLTLVGRTTSLVGMVEDVQVVVVSVISGKDIGDELQDRGFSDTSLSNNKNSVRYFRLVL